MFWRHCIPYFTVLIVIFPVTDGAGLGDGHVLGLTVLLPVHQLEFVGGPVAFVIVGGVVVLHRDGDDTLVVFIEDFLGLLFDLVVAVVGVFVDAADALGSIGEGALDEAILIIVFIGEQALGS